ncbi:MAG: sigma-70 family RNA polymerase sigma factor [Verrucomicrobiota bacterium]
MNETSSYSDQELLEAMHEKGVSGWDLFCTHFDPMIKSIARWPKWNFSEHEQEDVRQNIHVQLQSALPNFRQQSSLSWFIKRIAMRQCANEIRRQKRWRSVMMPAVQKTATGSWNEMEFANPDALDPHHEAVQSERRDNLRSALQQLNETCKESINLYYLKHRSYREIAEQLGIAMNTVGSRLSKCLDKLHENLRRHPSYERINE